MERPTRRQKKTPKKVKCKGNIKILNPFPWQEAYQIRKGEDLMKGCLTFKKPSPTTTTHLKIKTTCACYNTIDTLYI
jgi:hypothetical protein